MGEATGVVGLIHTKVEGSFMVVHTTRGEEGEEGLLFIPPGAEAEGSTHRRVGTMVTSTVARLHTVPRHGVITALIAMEEEGEGGGGEEEGGSGGENVLNISQNN